MKTPPRPPDEAERLAALRQYDLLDTAPEQALDDLTALAAAICEAPIALISLVDENRQWFKSKVGLSTSETSRDISFCGHGILEKGLFVVPDAAHDERFADNPLVTADPSIGFYAGARLMAPSEQPIGMLCVLDRVPRQLSPSQQEALRVLSRQVMAQLELRRQTRTLAENETRLRLALEAAHMGMFDWDLHSNRITWSRGHEELFDFRPGEFNGTFEAFAQRVHPDDLPGIEAEVTRCRNTREPFSREYRVVWTDGSVHWIEGLGEFSFDAEGRATRMRGVVFETTRRKRAEDTAQHHAAILRETGRIAKVGGWEFDPASGRGTWTNEVARIHDLDPSEGTSVERGLSFYSGESRERIDAALKQAVTSGTPYDLELELRTAKGNHKWVRTIGRPVVVDGKVVRVRGSFQDITERKVAEQKIVQLASFPLENPNPITEVNDTGRILSANPAAARLLPNLETQGFAHPWLAGLESQFEAIRESDGPVSREVEVGSLCYAQTLVYTRHTQSIRIYGYDITNRKEAEAALRKSEAGLAAAQARAHLGSWDFDLATRHVSWSEEMFRLCHRDPELGEPPHEDFADYVHPQDRGTILEVLAHIPEVTTPLHFENRTNPANGPMRYLSSTLHVLRDEAGQPVRAVGTTLDITDIRQAQIRVEQLNRVYAVLSDINQTIVRERDSRSMLAAACRIAVEKGRFRMAWVGLVEPPGAPLRVTAQAGANDETLQILRKLVEGEKPDCEFTFRALRDGQHGICNDIELDPSTASWRDAALQRNYRSMASLPLRIGDSVIGTFNLYSGEPDFFNAEEVQLLDELAMDISFALEVAQREIERHKTEEEVRWKTAFFEAQVGSAPDGILVVDSEGRRILQNQRMLDLLQIPDEFAHEAANQTQVDYVANRTKDPEQFTERIAHLYSHPEEFSRDVIEFVDGAVVERSSAPVHDKAGRYYGRIWTFRDITEQRQLEEQFRQSQKMEAVGQLAGGVAHDFNNILTVIHGYGSLLLTAGLPPKEITESAQEIVKASERAANLTRQLLAFSRRQVMQRRRIDLNDVVTSLAKMLQRILGEDIRMQLDLHPRALFADADAGMLDQLLLNLVVNARDAMAGGGRLFIETGDTVLSGDESALTPGAKPGPHVYVKVTDTGCGIAPEHLNRVFEPFFTTKEIGRGTGLGLATVFGIVKQHSGTVQVDSEVGRGTSFRITIPAAKATGDSTKDKAKASLARGKGETILLVEDDPAVRMLTRVVLERAGYQVLEASHGAQALEVAKRHQGTVDLLFTDIVMPEEMDGRELANQLRARDPKLRVVFTSGYSADIAGRELTLHEGQNFIQKPASPEQLLETVRTCLDA